MDTHNIIIGITMIIIGITMIWFLVCNERTFRQLTMISNRIGRLINNEDFNQARIEFGVFEKVTYYSHLFRLLTFRDPFVLYGRFAETFRRAQNEW